MREHIDMSREQLAAAAGMSVAQLELIESEDTLPPEDVQQQLANAFQMPAQLIMGLAITSDDIPEDRKDLLKLIHEPIRKLALDTLKEKHNK